MSRRRPPTRAREAVGAHTTSAGAVLVVGATTCVFALLLLAVLADHLTDEVASVARSEPAEIAMSLGQNPAGALLAVGDPEHDAAQVVGSDGAVVAASPNLAGHPPMVWPASPEPVQIVGPQDDEALLVVAHQAGPDRTVLVARTVQARDDSVLFVATLLAVGLPVLVLVVGLLCWKLVGRALRPVEAIRREVDSISSTALHRRVSEPPGADEIARLSTTMNRMLDRLDRAQQQQRRFVSDASHELRSPIAAIRQYAEVALMHPARTSVPELARSVLDEDLRVQHLVEDLLAARPGRRAPAAGCARRRSTSTTWCSTRPATSVTPRRRVDVSAVSGGRVRGRRRRAAPRAAEPRRERRPARPLPRGLLASTSTTTASSSSSTTTARASRPPSGTASCSGSCGSTRRAAATTAVPGSAWRSWRSWSVRTAAGWRSPTARRGARGCACPSHRKAHPKIGDDAAQVRRQPGRARLNVS